MGSGVGSKTTIPASFTVPRYRDTTTELLPMRCFGEQQSVVWTAPLPCTAPTNLDCEILGPPLHLAVCKLHKDLKAEAIDKSGHRSVQLSQSTTPPPPTSLPPKPVHGFRVEG